MDIIQMLNLIMVVMLVAILILAFVAVLLIYKMKRKKEPQTSQQIQVKTKEENRPLMTRDGKAIDSIYNFMEFDEILDNMIVRKNGKQYVMVIKCKGINYDLLSEDEKNAVEAGFLEFLNTLRFPIQLYVQTRTLNFTDILNNYHTRIDNIANQVKKLSTQIETAKKRGDNATVEKLEFERRRRANILEYGESVTSYTERLNESRNILQQKTYVIISYFTSEFGDTSTYSKEEINDIAFSELYTRAQTLIRALTSAEVTGTVLNSEELMELLYVAYNRDESEIYTLRNALNSQYDRLYSTARDVLEEKKKRIEKHIEEEATKMATDGIIAADKKIREERMQAKRIKERALELVEENKDEMSTALYEESKKQIEEGASNNQETKTRKVIRKNI